MPYQSVNGIKIYYEERDRASRFYLLINGLAFPMDLWFAQIEELSRDFRVMPGQPGHPAAAISRTRTIRFRCWRPTSGRGC
jgi:hypothetical protein